MSFAKQLEEAIEVIPEKVQGYGPCPQCGTVDVYEQGDHEPQPRISRERRKNGFTHCEHCDLKMLSVEWDRRVADESLGVPGGN